MFRLLRNKRVIMLMIGFILFIAIIGYSFSDRKELTWPEKFVGDVSGAVQEWFYKPAASIAGFFEDIGNLHTIYKENEQLRLTAAAYARDKVNYNFVEQENKQLKEDLHFTESQKNMYNYKYVIAQVIAVNNDANSHTMVINLGSKNGIKKGQAVTTVKGLVGIVSEVRPLTSTVAPITELDETSPESNLISATIMGKENDSFGIVSDYDHEKNRLVMTKIPENDKMAAGDTVITSGLGNVYPRGLIIGTVESKEVGDFGLTNTAMVKMAADFDHLTDVFVVQMPDTEAATE
ncbi:rod shape-determining protein MreC [Paenibacillus protaetiae]|uniref:Cell shape-determining protein MreC n=1 Tax=Paenibacillus protaetiae TaxID=2509456 RepID=A0A4P6EYT4_9BACL|nr:rod shape-determining protein MreC [Paenibacillus protaetiae]